MNEDDDIERLMRGECVTFESGPDGRFQLRYVVAASGFWHIAGTREALDRCVLRPLDGASTQSFQSIEAMLPAPAYRGKMVVAPGAVPPELWERARSLPERGLALIEEVRSGRWLPVESGWWFHDATLGLLHVDLQGAYVHAIEQPEERLAPVLWGAPDLGSTVPPEPLCQKVWPSVAAAAADLKAVLCGERALVDTPPSYIKSTGPTVVVAIGAKVVWLKVEPDGSLPERTALNPHAAVVEFRRLREQVLKTHFGRTDYDRRFRCETIPPVVKPLMASLEEGLRRTRREVVEAYLKRIREGMTISGGPTTDDSWTVSFEDRGFWISGYRPGTQGMEQTREPMTEARVREMLENYAMFGLRDLQQ